MTQYILIAYMALAVFDMVTTFIGLHKDKGQEANPILRWMFKRVGLEAGLVFVFAVKMALGIWLFMTGSFIALGVLVAIYTLVSINNVIILKNG